jgi:nucleotide-binding universal stress UspA family protein
MATAIPLPHRLESTWTPRRIVVGTDGSTHAGLACEAAADIARLTGAAVHVVAACEISPMTYGGLAMSSAQMFADDSDAAAANVACAAERMQAAGAATVTTHVAVGRPGLRILAEADRDGIDLIVVGGRGLGALQRIVLGSTSEEIVRDSVRPVLVVRGSAGGWCQGTVVIGYDGTESSHAAAVVATSLAAFAGIPARLVWVLRDAESPARAFTTELLNSAATRLAHRVGLRPSVEVAVGEPAHALLACAGACGLIALGARDRRRGLLGNVLGRVTARVLHAATGPVLVVPQQ